jgi:F-type H+-transporting ATPase subunit b
MPQLDPTWFASQLFWLAASFAALYFVMSQLVLPPLLAIMAKRRDTVDTDLSLAQGMKLEAEQARAAYESALAEARSKSQQLHTDAVLEYKQKAEAAGRALENEIASKLREAEQRITIQKQELMAQLTPVTAELTAMIVEKLASIRPDDSAVSLAVSRNAKVGR